MFTGYNFVAGETELAVPIFYCSHVLKLFYDNASPINARVPFTTDQCLFAITKFGSERLSDEAMRCEGGKGGVKAKLVLIGLQKYSECYRHNLMKECDRANDNDTLTTVS